LAKDRRKRVKDSSHLAVWGEWGVAGRNKKKRAKGCEGTGFDVNGFNAE